MEEAAKLIGAFERREERDPGVEANARLTGTTGLVLAVLFVLEGLTVPFIFRLLSWHIALGLLIIPPLALKIGSTSWKFSRYYLGDPRYRRAGPPHPLLRALGPVLLVSTVVLMGSGVALWLNGPDNDLLLLRVHQASFVIWFACVAVHFVSHFYRAVRLAAGDSRDAQADRPVLRRARLRRRTVALAFVAGVALAAFGHTVTTGWSHLVFGPVPAHAAPASPAPAPSTHP
jgi:Na+/phosphate symporter